MIACMRSTYARNLTLLDTVTAYLPGPSAGTMREDMDTLQQRLKVQAQRHCGSDEGSTGSSLRVVTPSMGQEAGKVLSSGTTTPQSNKFPHRFQQHTDYAGDRVPERSTTSPDCSWAFSDAPSPMSSPSAVYESSKENKPMRFEQYSQRTRCQSTSYSHQLCMHPADSSVSRCTALATPKSCSPATNHSLPAACMHCPDSEAKLVAARDAVVSPTLP